MKLAGKTDKGGYRAEKSSSSSGNENVTSMLPSA